VYCNLKRGLYLGTKKKTKGGYIKGRREYYFKGYDTTTMMMMIQRNPLEMGKATTLPLNTCWIGYVGQVL